MSAVWVAGTKLSVATTTTATTTTCRTATGTRTTKTVSQQHGSALCSAPTTSKTKEEGEEEEEEERCRVCLEGEHGGPLVQPCACRGSAKFIHKHCLEQWQRTSPKEDAAYRCGQCMDEYRDALSIELLSARLQAERTNGDDTPSWIHSRQSLRTRGS